MTNTSENSKPHGKSSCCNAELKKHYNYGNMLFCSKCGVDCPPPAPQENEWEKRFDEVWNFSFENEKGTSPIDNCKIFIRKELSQAEQRGAERERGRILERIKEQKKEIMTKEGEVANKLRSDTGMVAYYYLDKILLQDKPKDTKE